MIYYFFSKLSADKSLAMMAELSNFTQKRRESTPSLGRFIIAQRKRPFLGIAGSDLLDIFYSVLTESSRSYLGSYSGNIFRNGVIYKTKEVLNTIAQKYQDWTVENKEKDKPPLKKRGIIRLPDKEIKEAKKSIK
jgi:hypothetical protein